MVSSILSTRLLEHLKEVGTKQQYGSTRGIGCIDAQFCLRTAIHLCKQHGLDTWALFINLVKAIDTANHNLLFHILKKDGVSEVVISVIRRLYAASKVILQVGKELREILYGVGVKQGNNMAPVLFVYLMNAFAEMLEPQWIFTRIYCHCFPRLWKGKRKCKLLAQNPKPLLLLICR